MRWVQFGILCAGVFMIGVGLGVIFFAVFHG